MIADISLMPTTPWQVFSLVCAAVLLMVSGPLVLVLLRYAGQLSFNLFTDYFALGRYGHLPRPHYTGSWLEIHRGHFPRIIDLPPVEAHRQFVREAQSEVLVYRLPFWHPRLLLADVGAMLHILGVQRAYSFPKPAYIRSFVARSLGRGLLVVEGTKHKNQRKILQPAFSVSVIRDLMPCFFWHANRLVERLGRTIDACQGPSPAPQFLGQTAASSQMSKLNAPVLDMNAWMGRCSLDILGESGLDWSFDSICKDDPDQVQNGPRKVDHMSDAFQSIFTPLRVRFWEMLILVLRSQPGLRFLCRYRLPFEERQDRGLEVIQDLAQDIINTKREQILAEMKGEQKVRVSKANWEEGLSATGGKDLLFQMMRSNLSEDLTDSERMTDAELLGQMTTLLVVGHETTSTLLTWTLCMLAEHPEIQKATRQEIRNFVAESGRETMSYDDLTQLPLLDAVVKETLRVRAPLPSSFRVAAHDAVIPLSRPYLTRDGKSTFNHVLVRRGEELFLPLGLINTSETLWGADAASFRPERWFDVPLAAKRSGLPQHLLSFISGPRACIGNRFSLAEAKAILISLLLHFEFSPVENWKIETKQAIVLRFRVKGQEGAGMQLPLRISRAAP